MALPRETALLATLAAIHLQVLGSSDNNGALVAPQEASDIGGQAPPSSAVNAAALREASLVSEGCVSAAAGGLRDSTRRGALTARVAMDRPRNNNRIARIDNQFIVGPVVSS